MMSWQFWYWWVCWMFGFWFFHQRWEKGWSKSDMPLFVAASIASAAVTWFSWPLMIVYVISDWRKERKKGLDLLRQEAERRSRSW